MNALPSIYNFFKQCLLTLLLLLVKFYRLFISPVLPRSCRFYPSCSEYCQQALMEHGIIKGLSLSTKRICRCHPGTAGGIDLVPEKQS